MDCKPLSTAVRQATSQYPGPKHKGNLTMSANPMIAGMLKTMGIDPAAVAKMGGDIGAAFAKLTAAADRHTAMLETMFEEMAMQSAKIDAIMDRLEIARPMTAVEETIIANGVAQHIALLGKDGNV